MEDKKEKKETTPEQTQKPNSDENLVLHTSGGEMPDADRLETNKEPDTKKSAA